MITLSINTDKLDKSKIVRGEKGSYLDLVLIETPNGKYGDYLVKQGLSKEDRASKPDMPILGNAKILKPKGGNGGSRKPAPASDESDW